MLQTINNVIVCVMIIWYLAFMICCVLCSLFKLLVSARKHSKGSMVWFLDFGLGYQATEIMYLIAFFGTGSDTCRWILLQDCFNSEIFSDTQKK